MAGKLADLSQDELRLLGDFDLQLRSARLEAYRAIRLARAAKQQYDSIILQIVSRLDGTEKLPTATGLAGAAPFEKGDPGFLVQWSDNLVSWWDGQNDASQVALDVKAGGAINLVGQ